MMGSVPHIGDHFAIRRFAPGGEPGANPRHTSAPILLRKHPSLRWLLFALLVLCPSLLRASGCAPRFMPEHNNPNGWLGADAAYSIPLEGRRSLWIFGDTLYGSRRYVHGNEPRMVHNSLGISTCDAAAGWQVHYVLRHDHAGRPQSFFTPADSHHWYWPMDGFRVHNDLWILLLCVQPATVTGPGAMNFKTCGSDLAHLSHLDRDPQAWSVTISPLVPDGVGAYPSATAVVHDNYAYMFAVNERGRRPLVVTRVALERLDSARDSLEYLASDNQWKRGFDPSDAKEIMPQGSTELTIRYHADRRKWVAVMFDPHGISDKILFRTAPALTGPWDEGKVIYRVPERASGPSKDASIFCYAAKEHPEFEQSGQLLFTYVCNTMNVPSLAINNHIYFPQTVTVPWPE